MGRTQKILTVTLWGILVLAMVAAIGAGVADRMHKMPPLPPAAALDVLFDAPAFSLTDQNAKPASSQDLRGHVWIADFIFTQCASICPLMTQQMAQLQHSIPDSSVRMVSFSVDPTHDTPEVLKQYAKTRGADESRWFFLTSSKVEYLNAVANGFHMGVIPAGPDHPLEHAPQFLLIDAQQHVRGIYHANDPDSMQKLVRDAQFLAAEAGKDRSR
jgi:protein SCO1/2